MTGGLAGLAGIGGVAAGAFIGAVASVAHLGDEIVNTSEKLGVAADVLQELRYAADQSDVSFESLTTGLKFLSKNAAEAAQGNEDAMKSFAGINLRNGQGGLKTADQLLNDIIADFENTKDPIEQSRLAMKRFGRSGLDLVPMLKQGPEAIRRFIEDAHDLGVVLDKETLEASDAFDRSLKRLTSSFLGLRNTLGAPFVRLFADGMNAAADKVKTLQPHVKKLVAAIQDLWSRLKGVLGVMKAVGEKLFDFFFKGNLLGAILGATDGLKIFEATVIGLGAALIATAVSSAASWLLATAPFILIAAAIGFILDDITTFLEGGDSLLGRIIAWGDAVGDPDEHPLVKVLRKAIALLFDLSDPKKWAALRTQIRSSIFGGDFGHFITGVPMQAESMAQNGSNLPTQETPPTQPGGVGNWLGHLLTGVPMQAEAMSQVASLPGGAAGPMASFEPSVQTSNSTKAVTVNQSNATTIDARGMDPDQLKQTLDEHADDRARASFAAVGVR